MFLENCKFKGKFRKYQADVLEEFYKHIEDKKINIVAAPGSGKTILGLQIICNLNQPVLVLAPTITIRDQWKERFINFYAYEGMKNVPSILDNDKKDATVFLDEWNSNVCKARLIYTRSKEGRKILLRARKNSIAHNKNFFVKKEVSKWS